MNTITIDMLISNDFEGQSAVKKVSDKLTVLRTYLPGVKKEGGGFGKSLPIETKVTTKTEVKGNIEAQKRVRVTGFIEVGSYTKKDGTEVTYPVIVAQEVEVLEQE